MSGIQAFSKRSVLKGQVIMREGEPGNCAYLIQSGRVVVFTHNDENKPVELARLSSGEIFGEMALVGDVPRSATVTALEDCSFIVITREVLDLKLNRSDSTIQALISMLIKRMALSNRTIAAHDASVKDLVSSSQALYQAILAALPEDQKRDFEQGVSPKMDAFIEALTAFDQKFAQ